MNKPIPVTITIDLFELIALVNCAQLGASALIDTDTIPSLAERASYERAIADCATHSQYAIDEIGGGPAWRALTTRLGAEVNGHIEANSIENVRLKRDPTVQ